MLIQLLSAFFLVISATGASAGVDLSPPIQKEVRSALDAKILYLHGEWVIAFSDNTVQVIRSDQLDRFNALMLQWNNVIPSFVIYENFDQFYPYSILFPDSGETFALVKPIAARDLWILKFGEGKLFTLESKEYPAFSVNEDSFWQLSNTDAHWNTLDRWNIGDPVVIVPILAESRQWKKMAGYMIFHFETVNQAEEWLSGNDTHQTNGYWIQSLAN